MNLYQESQIHIEKAEKFLSIGEIDSARSHYILAAELQWSFVNSLPEDRIRTISVYGLSAATLFYRGNDLERSESLAYLLLSKPNLESYSKSQLRELLARVWNERQMEEIGYRLPVSPLSVIFRKGSILHGLAPTDAIDTPIRSVFNLFQRLAAWMCDLPLTKKPDAVLNERYRAFSSEPALGSYRIDLYIAQDDQLALEFPGITKQLPLPDDVITSFLDFMSYASNDDYDSICSFIPDDQYRKTLVRLARNIVPDGTQVGEVEIRRANDYKEKSVTLVAEHRSPFGRMIKKCEPIEKIGNVLQEVTKHTGILRAVDLDKNELRLDMDNETLKFKKADDIVDDVVGSLLNKRVVIVGNYRSNKSSSFLATDIDLAV
jgi:hypothetical protein